MSKKKKQNAQSSENLTFRLNAKLLSIHFANSLSAIIILSIISFVAIFIYAESTVSGVIDDFETASSGTALHESFEEQQPLELGRIKITYDSDSPEDMPITPVLFIFFPSNTEDANRFFTYDDSELIISQRLRSIDYNLAFEIKNEGEDAFVSYQIISINIGELFYLLMIVVMILVGLMFFSLLTTGFRMRRAVNRALEPLRNLREATEAFADSAKTGIGEGAYSEDALRNLAGSLNAINTTQFDQRIPSEIVAGELQPLAAAINEMIDRIDESYSAQTRFVSDASHELRTPIAVIQGYANLLLRWGAEDPKTLTESIEAIKSEADSMKQMVNQLLFLARGDAKSMKLDFISLDLSKLAREVIKEEIMIDQAHLFESEIDDDIFIFADSGLIKQLFRIILDNSIKYTGAGGRIIIRLEKTAPELQIGSPFSNGRARLIIQDEGTGIPADILPHIFDRFVRADESRTRNTGGAGLGLSIAKWIVEKNGGYIEVLSNEGLGTRFTVTLPISKYENTIS